MIPKVATQILHHTSRAAAVAHNQTTHTIRNVLQIQSSSGNASSSSLPGRSGAGPNSHWGSNGAGPGGSKYNPGTRFQNGYNGPGRAITQVNTATSHDASGETDDNEELALKRLSFQAKRTRPRSHSLSLGHIPQQARGDKLAVLETVQLHARSRHAFAQPSSKDNLAIPVSANALLFPSLSTSYPPSLARHNSTSVSPVLGVIDALPCSPLVRSSSPHSFPPMDPTSPQSAIPPKVPPENPGSQPSALEALESARNSGDPTKVLAEVLRMRNSSVNPSVREFNMAIDALCETRRRGEPLTPILETYNDMLNHNLLPNLKTYFQLIQVLTERDQEVHKLISGLENRRKRREFLGKIESAAHAGDHKQIAQLQSENNFSLAMSLFEAVIAIGGNAKLPLTTYQNLLCSCSYHSNVDAAIHVFAQLETRGNLLPNAAVYAHLISLYTNVRDLQGAQEVFTAFREASKSEQIEGDLPSKSDKSSGASTGSRQATLAHSGRLVVWNKMIKAYFRCGQPAGALGLLEQMMDTKTDERLSPVDIPLPASSTFSGIIAGFCQSGDVQTALVWFNQLLQQQQPGRHPYQSSTVPPRPDQTAWMVMLDTLATAGMVEDLNRLFASLLENASRDELEVRAADRILVFYANMKHLDSNLNDRESMKKLDFMANHVLLIQSNPHSLFDFELHTMTRTLIQHYFKRQAPDKALTTIGKYVDLETAIIREGESIGRIPSIRLQKRMTGVRDTVIETSSHLFTQVENLPFENALTIMRISDRVGLLPSRSISLYYLRAYISARECGDVRDLELRDWELLAYSAAALELPPAKDDVSAALKAVDCRTTSILEDMAKDGVDLTTIHATVRRIAKALSLRYNINELQAIFAKLGPDYERVLNDPNSDQQASPNPLKSSNLISENGVSNSEIQCSKPIHIDVYHSRFIDEFYPTNPNVSPLTAYARFEAGLDNNVYPVPATIGRLIGALGRLGEVEKVRKLYGEAQLVLAALEHDKKWQSQAWFHIEDQMIVAYAHMGDLESAHIHRARILDHGGAPTADSYGALIECVKDTTDDTSNALALFQESQMHNVPPNIYLFNNVISKLAKARKADFALELFQQMKASRIQPSSITYGAVIAACARVGDSYSAELLFTEMTMQRNFKPRVPPFNTMMQLYAHIKPNRERVLYYYNALLKANVRPTAHTYKLLIDAYGTIEPVDVESMEIVFRDLHNDPRVQIQGSHWAAMINAWGGAKKDLNKAISIFESISTHPSTQRSLAILPDAVTFEALINVFVAHRRTDLIPQYIERLESMGVHMTAYIANCLIRGYAAVGDLEQARLVFDSLLDPPEGVAAPNNHAPHEPSSSSVPVTEPVYREPSTWEVMIRAELGNGHRERAVELLGRLQARKFPSAVYNRIRGIMLDDPSLPWPSEVTQQE